MRMGEIGLNSPMGLDVRLGLRRIVGMDGSSGCASFFFSIFLFSNSEACFLCVCLLRYDRHFALALASASIRLKSNTLAFNQSCKYS